jgi:hypothetical protein
VPNRDAAKRPAEATPAFITVRRETELANGCFFA